MRARVASDLLLHQLRQFHSVMEQHQQHQRWLVMKILILMFAAACVFVTFEQDTIEGTGTE